MSETFKQHKTDGDGTDHSAGSDGEINRAVDTSERCAPEGLRDRQRLQGDHQSHRGPEKNAAASKRSLALAEA